MGRDHIPGASKMIGDIRMDRDELIETLAKAIYEAQNGHGCYPWIEITKNRKVSYLADSKVVLAAIEASGHCIVPVEPDDVIIKAGVDQSTSYPVCPPGMQIPPIHQFPMTCCYRAMIAAGRV